MAINLCDRVFRSSSRYFESVEDGLQPCALADVDLVPERLGWRAVKAS